jgi:uncharacterized damage-inducible protein DinB
LLSDVENIALTSCGLPQYPDDKVIFMEQTAGVEKLLGSWRKIPRQVEKTVKGVSKEELDARKSRNSMSIHETVHHLVEANIVAASMIIAAIGKDGATYDWTWLYPNADWIKRLGYAKAPIQPAIKMLDCMNEHIANLVRVNPKVLKRKVTLRDKPDSEQYTMTVEQIMSHEVEHAIDHLKEAELD